MTDIINIKKTLSKYKYTNKIIRSVYLTFNTHEQMDLDHALAMASKNGNIDCVRIFLDYGANPLTKNENFNNAIHQAILTENLDIVRLILKNIKKNEHTYDVINDILKGIFLKQSLDNKRLIIKELLFAGAYKSPFFIETIFEAIYSLGPSYIVCDLLEFIKNTDLINSKNVYKMNVLMHCLNCGYQKCSKYIIDNFDNIDFNAVHYKERSALYLSFLVSYNYEFSKELLKKGHPRHNTYISKLASLWLPKEKK